VSFFSNLHQLSFFHSCCYQSQQHDAYADGVWIFQPLSSHVNIDLEWSFLTNNIPFSSGEVWLKDVTQGTDLFNMKIGASTPNPRSYSFQMDLDPTHFYEWEMYSQATSSDDKTGINLRASFSVPEPTTILLLGPGLISLIWLKRKFQS
jgi:hypothetical protein